jgi:hypothetical protein
MIDLLRKRLDYLTKDGGRDFDERASWRRRTIYRAI